MPVGLAVTRCVSSAVYLRACEEKAMNKYVKAGLIMAGVIVASAASAATTIDVSTVGADVLTEVKAYAAGVGPAIVSVAVVMIGIKYGKKLLGKI